MPKVLIVGMGISGLAAAKLAVLKGFSVLGVDRNPQQVSPIEGCTIHSEHDFELTEHKIELVVVSPGVPKSHHLIVDAITIGLPIISEVNFASRFTDVPIIAVTGTNGKSSTVWYAQQIATQLGYQSFLGGNFGTPLSEMVLQLSNNRNAFSLAIVEISSYQMEWSMDFHPSAAGILNLTPDHLARHKTINEYRRCKLKLFDHLSPNDTAIFPYNDRSLHAETPAKILYFGPYSNSGNHGCFVDKSNILWNVPSDNWSMPIANVPLLGQHNLENISVACLLIHAVTQEPITPQHIQMLQPLEHRLESVYVRERHWINDSKATNLDATIAALNSLEERSVVLLGGAGKDGADYTLLVDLLKEKSCGVICFGRSRQEIYTQLHELLPKKLHCTQVIDLSSAIQLARLEFAPHPVLLSPACASFDEFANFAERGRYFKDTLLSLDSP